MPSAMPTASAMTFLTAPPSSQPTTSVLVYGRKYGGVAGGLEPPGDRLVAAGDDGGGGLPVGDLAGQVGPVTHGDPLRGRRLGDLLDDLAHPLGGAEFDALHQADQHRVAGEQRRPVGQVARAASATGTARTTNSAPSAASRRVGGGA